jgi:hypothetical protein
MTKTAIAADEPDQPRYIAITEGPPTVGNTAHAYRVGPVEPWPARQWRHQCDYVVFAPPTGIMTVPDSCLGCDSHGVWFAEFVPPPTGGSEREERESSDALPAPAAALPEPPDGTRLEFECGADVYAVWRSDLDSAHVGWSYGPGGETWAMYGETVPCTWLALIDRFGDQPLRDAVRLLVHPEDAHKIRTWPTQLNLLRQLAESAERDDEEAALEPLALTLHNLDGARWTKAAWEYLIGRKEAPDA